MKSRADLCDGERKVEDFLTYLARDRRVAASTQNQALNALVFFYKQVLKQPLDQTINAERASRKPKIPVVLTREETARLLDALAGKQQLVVRLLYGCGLRISECLRLRVQGTPEIFNTDQGSQFTSESFTGVLLNKQIAISMDGRGRALDNVFIERLWWSAKHEEVYPKPYADGHSLHRGPGNYFDYCNNEKNTVLWTSRHLLRYSWKEQPEHDSRRLVDRHEHETGNRWFH